ncbi:MAG: flagellar assembly protein FliW [Methyloprofundus sp.]|nr:flagellar assembly protein FliW [Methyloprofundus sp.]
MEIKSKLLGEQVVDPDTIITFPHGIPGFETDTRFKFFHQEGSDIVFWLQSVDNEEVLFSVAHPTHFNINYSFTLTDEEEATLELEGNDDLIIMIILHKSADSTEHPTIKGSIKSPLIINAKTRKGMQKILVQVEQSITLTETSNEIDLSAP